MSASGTHASTIHAAIDTQQLGLVHDMFTAGSALEPAPRHYPINSA